MDPEKIDVLDKNGNPTGEIMLKTEAHKKGVWHRAVHIWIYNSKGEVLIQKRAKRKKHYPDLWDISAAGHVSAGQTFAEAAVRELYEELGVKVKEQELKKVEVRKLVQDVKNPFLCNREYVQVYLLRLNKPIKDFKLEEEEVEQVKFMPLEEFEAEINDPAKVKKYVHTEQFFEDAAQHIRKALKEND
jgi:isopentenyl-diphosphate delta-isomerase